LIIFARDPLRDGPVTLHLGDEDIQLIPVRAAHADGIR